MILTILKIDGMKCGMCEAHVNDIIRKNFKIKKVSSNHKLNETKIISDEEIDTSKIKEELNHEGYRLLDDNKKNVKKTLFGYKEI